MGGRGIYDGDVKKDLELIFIGVWGGVFKFEFHFFVFGILGWNECCLEFDFIGVLGPLFFFDATSLGFSATFLLELQKHWGFGLFFCS